MSVEVDQRIDNTISGLLNIAVPTSSPSLAYLVSSLIVEPKSASCTSVISCVSGSQFTRMLLGLMSEIFNQSTKEHIFLYERLQLTCVDVAIAVQHTQSFEDTFGRKLQLLAGQLPFPGDLEKIVLQILQDQFLRRCV
jgi:hypothetical protein